MHRPFVDVFVSAQHSGIQGTFRGGRTYMATGSGRIVGARFRPGAFHAFWRDGALADLQDRIVDLSQVFETADATFVVRVSALGDQATINELQALLRSKKPQPDANVDLMNAIILAVEADEDLRTVAAVAANFVRSERWVQQVFRDNLGHRAEMAITA